MVLSIISSLLGFFATVILTLASVIWLIFQEAVAHNTLANEISPSFTGFSVIPTLLLISITFSSSLEIVHYATCRISAVSLIDVDHLIFLEALSISGVSTIAFLSTQEGIFTIFPISFFFLTLLFAISFLLRTEGPFFDRKSEDDEDTFEITGSLSKRFIIVLVIFLLSLTIGFGPYLLLIRSTWAMVLVTILFFVVYAICAIVFLAASVFVFFLNHSKVVQMSSLTENLFEGAIFSVLIVECTRFAFPSPIIVGISVVSIWILFPSIESKLSKHLLFQISVESKKRGAMTIAIIKSMKYNFLALLLCFTVIIGTTAAYNETTGLFISQPLSAVRIAIIDSGVNTDHSLLRKHVVMQKSFIDIDYGYDRTETDPLPSSLLATHGTLIAMCILDVFPSASLVSAKVWDSTTDATREGIIQAIRWSVLEAEVDVINLSFSHVKFDIENGRYDEILEWSWKKGVIIVVSAGNSNGDEWSQDGYSTIGDPSSSPYAITVGAVNSTYNLYPFSSNGPSVDGRIKPEIVALGNLFNNDRICGTSFSSPRVAGYAAFLIDELESNGTPWTPGLIKTAIVKGAAHVDYQEYEVGAGLVDVDESLRLIREAPVNENNLPLLVATLPSNVPLNFENLFCGVNYSIPVSIFCSTLANISIEVPISLSGIVSEQTAIFNQTGILNLYLTPPHESVDVYYEGIVNITDGYTSSEISLSFIATVPRASIGFITCFDARNIYSTYTVFSQFYQLITQNGIAVSEIRTLDEFQKSNLTQYDSLVLLNPYAYWSWKESRCFNSDDADRLSNFVQDGGGLLFSVGSTGEFDRTRMNITSINLLLNWTGIQTLAVTGMSSWLEIENHAVTEGIKDLTYSLSQPRLHFRFFNTTANFTHIIHGRLICSNITNRIICFGAPYFFENVYLELSESLREFVVRMMKWISSLLVEVL